MKMIALLTVAAMLLSTATMDSSVGGPMTNLFITFVAILAVGIYEAWSKERGALGWIVSIVVSVIGGVLAVALVGMAMEMVLDSVRLEGSLASSHRLLLSIVSVPMPKDPEQPTDYTSNDYHTHIRPG